MVLFPKKIRIAFQSASKQARASLFLSAILWVQVDAIHLFIVPSNLAHEYNAKDCGFISDSDSNGFSALESYSAQVYDMASSEV